MTNPSVRLFMMSSTISLLLLMACSSVAIPAWAPEGSVVLAPSVNHRLRLNGSPDAEGGGYFAIVDVTNGTNRVHLQRITGSGVVPAPWGPEGRFISYYPGTDQRYFRLVPDGAGGSIVFFSDNRTFNGFQMWAVRFNADGNIATGWMPAGIQASANNFHDMCASEDALGGGIACWVDFRRLRRDLFAMRVGPNGQVLWPQGGMPVSQSGEVIGSDDGPDHRSAGQMCPDGAGGAYVCWLDWRTGVNAAAYVQHIQANGQIAGGWPPDGLAVSQATETQVSPDIVSDGNGGVIVIWGDAQRHLLLARHILPSGSSDSSWPQPTAVLADSGCGAVGNVADGAGGVITAWIEEGEPQFVHLTHLAANGLRVDGWPSNGVRVGPLEGGLGLFRMSSDGSGGCFLVWQDVLVGQSKLMGTRVSAGGHSWIDWPARGVPLSVSSHQQTDLSLVQCVGGGAIAGWLDVGEDGTEVRAQQLHDGGIVATLASFVSASREPRRIVLTWYSGGDPGLKANVYRRTHASDWQLLRVILSDGNSFLRCEDDDVADDVSYGYRLGIVEPDQGESTLGETWLDPTRADFALLGTGANPSSDGRASLSFALPLAATARVQLFDIAGREVDNREIGGATASSQSVEFGAGARLRAGVYLVRATSGPVTLTRRIVVLN